MPFLNTIDRSISLPPKAKRLPLVGSLPYLLNKKMNFLIEMQGTLGDIFVLDVGLTNMVILAHPRHAQLILRTRIKNYDKGNAFYSAMRNIAGDGLATTNNWDLWLRQRRMIQPYFHRTQLEKMSLTMTKAIDTVFADLTPLAQTQDPVDFSYYFARTTMTIIIHTIFGTDMDAADAADMEKRVADTLDYTLPATLTNGLPMWAPIPGRRKFMKNLAAVDRHIYKVIEESRHNMEDAPSLIGMLINMVDAETNEQMTDQQLRDEAMTMFLAGSETTASILEWVVYYLNENPETKRLAYEEVDRVLGQREPTFDDLPNLTYLYRVLQETLRLRAPGYWLPRRAIEADEIDGYYIPKDQMIMVMVHLIHHNPAIWDEPFQFDPDRFLPEREAQRPPMSWIPFGSGQRQCIGRDFAIMEGQLIMARLMQQFYFEAAPGKIVRPYYATTQRTAGIDLVLAPR